MLLKWTWVWIELDSGWNNFGSVALVDHNVWDFDVKHFLNNVKNDIRRICFALALKVLLIHSHYKNLPEKYSIKNSIKTSIKKKNYMKILYNLCTYVVHNAMGDAIALSASDTMGGEGVLPSIPLPPIPLSKRFFKIKKRHSWKSFKYIFALKKYHKI